MGCDEMRSMHIKVDNRNGHKKSQRKVEEQPEIRSQYKTVGEIMNVYFCLGDLLFPSVNNFDKKHPLGHTNDIAHIMNGGIGGYQIQMMAPVKQHIEKTQEKQCKHPFIESGIGLFADAFHYIKSCAIDQHIVCPHDTACSFPLDDHILDKRLPEIGDDPEVVFYKNKQEINNARAPHPDIDRPLFDGSNFEDEYH